MRVPLKRTSLPQVMEDKGEADGNLKLQPLPEMISESFPGKVMLYRLI